MGKNLIEESIVTNNQTFAGKPTIRDTRIAVLVYYLWLVYAFYCM
jgi:uncharacterized protein (DUF433 family)